MNKRCVKELKAGWTKTASGGGHFLVVMNGWPEDEQKVPVLAVDPKKELKHAEIGRWDKDVDLSSKRISGRVSVEDGELAFNVAQDSHTRSPQLLKKALRHVAELDQTKSLRLQQLLRASCRMDESEQLVGEAALTGVADLEKKAGKASLLSRIRKSAYAKLLAGVNKWQADFGNRLTSSSYKKAAVALDDLRDRCKAWSDENGGPSATGERAKQISNLRNSVRLARERLNAFQARVQGDDEVDRLVEQLLGDNPPNLGDDESRAATLHKIQESLGRRRATSTDADEQKLLGEQMDAIDAKVGEALIQLGDRLSDTSTMDPKKVVALQKGRGQMRGARHEALMGRVRAAEDRNVTGRYASRVPQQLVQESVTLVDELGLELLDAGEGLAEELTTRMLDTATTLEGVGSEGTAKEVIETATRSVMALTRQELVAAVQGKDVASVLSTLNRQDSPASKARRTLVFEVGREYAGEVLNGAALLIAAVPQLKPGVFDESKEPGSTDAWSTLDQVFEQADQRLHAANAKLYGRLRARLRCDLPDGELARLISQARPVSLSASGSVGDPPTVDEVIAYILQHAQTVRQTMVESLVKQGMEAISRRAIYDTAPPLTERLLRERAAELIAQLGPIDLGTLLVGWRPDHWEGELDHELTARILEDEGLLDTTSPEESQQADRLAQDEAREGYRQLDEFKAGPLEDAVQGALATSTRTLKPIYEAFVSTLDRIFSDPLAVPGPIRRMCVMGADTMIETGLGDAGTQNLAADLLMLRWISPSIVRSYTPPTDDAPPSSSTALTLSALVQNVANGVVPTSEQLRPFARVVETYIPKFREFVRELLRLTREERHVSFDGELVDYSGVPLDSRPIDEESLREDPAKHWGHAVRKRLRSVAMAYAKRDGLSVLWGSWEEFLAPVRQYHREHFGDDGAFAKGFKGRSKLVNDTMSMAEDLMRDEGKRVAEGGDDSLMFRAMDEEDRYDQAEHWSGVMIPRFIANVNSLMSQSAYANLAPTGDLSALFAPLEPSHRAVFDADLHNDLPQKDDRADPLLVELLVAARQLADAQARRVVEGGESPYFRRA